MSGFSFMAIKAFRWPVVEMTTNEPFGKFCSGLQAFYLASSRIERCRLPVAKVRHDQRNLASASPENRKVIVGQVLKKLRRGGIWEPIEVGIVGQEFWVFRILSRASSAKKEFS